MPPVDTPDNDATADDGANDRPTADWPGTLSVRTLGGNEHVVEDLAATTPVAEVLSRLGRMLGAAPIALLLLAGHEELEPTRTLSEAGLAVHGASAVVIRRQMDAGMMRTLFQQLSDEMGSRGTRCSKRLRELVDAGAGFDTDGGLLRSANGGTMLNLAIRKGLPDLALHLLARAADAEAVGDNGRRPLASAVLRRLDNVAEELLARRADAAARDHNGTSALAYALRQGNDALAARLLGLAPPEDHEQAFLGLAPSLDGLMLDGDEVQAVMSGRARLPPLILSCANAMPLAAASLLRARAEANARDAWGRPALRYALARELGALAAEMRASGAEDEAAADSAGRPLSEGVREAPPPAPLAVALPLPLALGPRRCRFPWIA